MPSERSRYSGNGFELVAQVDTDDYDGDRVGQQRLSGRERFRGTVQQILRHTSVSHNAGLLSAQSSPALSDTTLTNDDYLSLPIQQFDEVDLVTDHDGYAEAVGSYGPEVVDRNSTPSHSFSTKAGKGLEVRVESYPLALSPSGLFLDDRPQDFSYRGSEGIVDNSLPVSSSSLYNYKPVPLRWRFIIIVFGSLVVLLVLSQSALRLLPDASNMDELLPAFQNITEIRKRSGFYNDAAGNNERFSKYGNHTEATVSTRVYSTSKFENQPTSSTYSFSSVQSSTTQSSTTQSSTTQSSATQSSTQSSATETAATTTETQSYQTSTTQSQITGVIITTTYQSPTQSDEHQSTTATPTLNDPGPNDHSTSTQSKPDDLPTSHDQNLPGPSLTQTTTTLRDTTHPPLETSLANSSPSSPDEPLSPPPIPTPTLASTGIDEQQTGEGAPNQDPSKSIAGNPPDSSSLTTNLPTYQSAGQLTDQPKGQSAGQQAETNNGNTGSSSPTTHQVPPLIISSQTFRSTDSATKAKSSIKINTPQNILAQTGSPSPSTQLPDGLEQYVAEDAKPFTTITMTQNPETTPPPITTIITTSSSIANGSFVELTMTTTIFNHLKLADPLTDFTATTTYANGTVSVISEQVYDMVWTSVKYDAAGKPTATEYVHVLRSSQETTLRDPLGFPTATLYYYDVESTATLYNSDHIATATITTTIPETTEFSTMYDADGRPTKTTILLRPIPTYTVVVAVTPTPSSSPSSNAQKTLKLRRLPDGIYFAGLMLPTLLTILICIPIRILDRNVKLYQGFHALASDRGASAAESLCLKTTGPSSLLYGLWSLRNRQYLLGLTSALVFLSALAIPFSAEVFRLILQGAQCRLDGAEQTECSVALGVFPAPAQVLSALLIVLILGVILVALLLRRWKTGVNRDPWSILDMAQLAASADMRKILERLRCRRKAGHKGINELAKVLRAKIFGLREWEDEKGIVKRGLLILTQECDDSEEQPIKKADRSVTFADIDGVRRQRAPNWPSGDSVPFFVLSWTGRILFLLLLSGVLIAVLTYDIVARGSEYQRGLTGKAVGVRFLFSGAGVLVTFAWTSFFNAVAFLSPYKLLRRRRLNKGQAISLSPATNHFTGLWLAFIPSRRDLYLGVVATTAILSEVLPLSLGNIPCNGVQIESAETVCVYLSVTILSFMILIVGWSFFVDWPLTMGADPSTIAGAMYAAHVLSVEQPLKRFFKKEGPGIV
ncbi:hypothetical protein F5Y12DRAFT_720626 [Xylaria sp. FL1777]|nr:hypothetical protein F5Y12DRAFT_720626 [Xylaria sp. FL1777]